MHQHLSKQQILNYQQPVYLLVKQEAQDGEDTEEEKAWYYASIGQASKQVA